MNFFFRRGCAPLQYLLTTSTVRFAPCTSESQFSAFGGLSRDALSDYCGTVWGGGYRLDSLFEHSKYARHVLDINIVLGGIATLRDNETRGHQEESQSCLRRILRQTSTHDESVGFRRRGFFEGARTRR